MSTAAATIGNEPDALSGSLAEAIGERLLTRGQIYEPFRDLASRSGVDLQWHSGRVNRWERPWGVTDFSELSISMLAGLSEMQFRCTLAHELLHLERGPFEREIEDREEAKISLLTGQRLIDPILYDLLEADAGDLTARRRSQILRVDARTLRHYAAWRKKVTARTAMARWKSSAHELPVWPPLWLQAAPARTPIAASFAQSREVTG